MANNKKAVKVFQEYARKYCKAVEAEKLAKDKMDSACTEDYKASYGTSPHDMEITDILAEIASHASYAYEDARNHVEAVLKAYLKEQSFGTLI